MQTIHGFHLCLVISQYRLSEGITEYLQANPAWRIVTIGSINVQRDEMAVYVGLEMNTETALKLLGFLRMQDGCESDVSKFFGEFERQVLDSLEYEATYIQGALSKKPSN